MKPPGFRLQRLPAWRWPMVLLGTWLLAGWVPAAAAAQAVELPGKGAALFASQEPLGITIRAPWRDLVRRKSDPTAYPAALGFTDAPGSAQALAITVERRGLSRQKACEFPPIKLRFAGGAAKGSVFDGEKSIKLVTHCDKDRRWEQYYIKEMLAYRIYNAMTDRSFRVRPLAVTYVDSKTNASDGPHFAFLVEDDDAVRKRNHLKKVKLAQINPAQLEPLASSRFALFEYLIGNTDWAVLSGPSKARCCHNSVLMGSGADAGIVAVPYDFDASGLVDASYAVPAKGLRIRSVTERVYRGFCIHNATLDQARREYLDKEQAILDMVRDADGLDARNRGAAMRYLGRFFEVMRSPSEFAAEITGKCRK